LPAIHRGRQGSIRLIERKWPLFADRGEGKKNPAQKNRALGLGRRTQIFKGRKRGGKRGSRNEPTGGERGPQKKQGPGSCRKNDKKETAAKKAKLFQGKISKEEERLLARQPKVVGAFEKISGKMECDLHREETCG